ncbi:MAG: putative DNA binding domain-containing protein [Firmicutes bacterium]|nr:putative DNA binding domain-containing protein [Bacillota bacterium]
MENSVIEYKLKVTEDIEKTIVAFLNTTGGKLLIGVDKNGEVVGLENADKDSLAIADKIRQNIIPSAIGLFDINIEEMSNKHYIVVRVAGGMEKPYYIKKYGMSPKGCFVRIGSQSVPMEQSAIDSLYAKRAKNTLKNIVAPRQNLTFSMLKIFYKEKGIDVEGEHFLTNLDLITQDGKYNYVAYLMADSNSSSFKVVRYEGLDKVKILSKKDYGNTSILVATKNILENLNILNTTTVEITYPKRIETSLVDPVALREAALNALIHHDYSKGTEPVFEFYDDRVAITSYGGLPIGLTQEEFFAGRSLPRNRELMRIFKDMEYAESLGSGMNRIMSIYGKDSFDISENFLSAVFKYDDKVLSRLKEKAKDKAIEAKSEINKLQSDILQLIKTNNNLSAKQIAETIGNATERTIQRNLDTLKEIGYIERVGSRKTGSWKIVRQ